ncbi:hypothetical protein FGO68_gene9160 [Halteria grandinella]|uniref:Uncharacterized protein n=1 Tax=Halteria grandinella TaxID=5974 RepID=A0A8J8NKG3_HALGN|nr:hypothetical protein FGO68_gene9160 [Halteria grandinella]
MQLFPDNFIYVPIIGIAAPLVNWLAFYFFSDAIKMFGGFSFYSKMIQRFTVYLSIALPVYLIVLFILSLLQLNQLAFFQYFKDLAILFVPLFAYIFTPINDFFSAVSKYILTNLLQQALPFYLLIGYAFSAVCWLSSNSGSIYAHAIQDLAITRALLYYLPLISVYGIWIVSNSNLLKLAASNQVAVVLVSIASYIQFVLPAALNVGEVIYV